MAKVAICVPCWNNVWYTRQMVSSVLRNSAGHQCFFVFLDNGSTDDTVAYLRSVPGVAHLIRKDHNTGVNPAWNEILDHALPHKPDVVCLANNDILVGPQWLDAVSAEITKDDKRYFLPNGQFTNPKTFDADVRRSLPNLQGTKPARAGWCMFFHPSALPLFLPIPAELKLWYGDDWIHHKLQKAGYKCEAVMKTCCLHYVSKTIQFYPGRDAQIASDRAAYRRLTGENV
ncbi:MAG: glycosyltransferase [Gammaproteobacteria bacterium]|nr:glycosyltransferase [Gammaproteobacteria bacterium]